MSLPRSIVKFSTALLILGVLAMDAAPAYAQISSFSVGADQTTSSPSNLTSWPDEHVTFMPSSAANGYLVFGSSAVRGGMGGAVALQTQDLQSFSLATNLGYAEQVMNPPVAFTACNPAFDAEFDENYSGPGTVVQDPTLPPGNLIVIYEAENHCPGGVNQFDYYATAGLARSSDNGKTWPAPVATALGGANRYPILKSATPEPTTPENQQVNLGNAIPSAYVDGNNLYIVYENVASPSTPADSLMRIARANLIADNVNGTLQFHKWFNGAFSQPGIGGLDSSPLPSSGCNGNQRQGSLAHDDDLGVYIMIFLCIDGAQGQAGWYYSSATSLGAENWTAPQLITGSLGPWVNPCPGASSGGSQFDGFYPSIMSPGLPVGHIHNTGRIYFLNGCDGGTNRAFDYRAFTITGAIVGGNAPPSTAHDFNGDSKSDVLWRDNAGNVGMWLMNGQTVAKGAAIGNAPTNWTVVGQRDFTGNGNAGILWRDTAGNVGMWLMNGNQITLTSVLGNVPTTWSVAATGDFNNDQMADILWRDNLGNVGIWLMNGTAILQSTVIGNVPTSWVIAGADMNGEIFWRNSVTGEVGIWTTKGGTIAQTVDLGPVPLTWSIAGVGDFDGNGSTDILWRDNLGNVAIWLMNGTQIMSTAVVGNVPSNWTVAQTGDYNGDTKTDILWVDNLGNVAVWFMNGTAVSSVATYGNVGSAWSVQALNAD